MHIQPIGVPYDLHQFDADMDRLLALLLPRLTQIAGVTWAAPVTLQAQSPSGDDQADLAGILTQLGREIRQAHERGALPVIIGGDCMVALGVMSALDADAAGAAWLDAHGDFNTPETTLSGYLGGMPLAIIVGRGMPELRAAVGLTKPVPEEHVALLGVRDLDPPEQAALATSAVAWLTTEQVRAAPDRLEAALLRLSQCPQVYLHLDVDILDPAVMPAVGFPTPAGLTMNELQALLAQLRQRCNLAAVTVTAFDPTETNRESIIQTVLPLIETVVR